MKFCFGDIVVVEDGLIGVVVKSWGASSTGSCRPAHHEVYVSMYRIIKEYNEDEIERYMVRHKYLDEQEMEWQANAIRG